MNCKYTNPLVHSSSHSGDPPTILMLIVTGILECFDHLLGFQYAIYCAWPRRWTLYNSEYVEHEGYAVWFRCSSIMMPMIYRIYKTAKRYEYWCRVMYAVVTQDKRWMYMSDDDVETAVMIVQWWLCWCKRWLLDVSFIHLFVYIYWSNRMDGLMLYLVYHALVKVGLVLLLFVLFTGLFLLFDI